MESEYLHAVTNLLLVLGLIVFCLFLLKKFRFSQFKRDKYINIIQNVPLGTKERIVLIEVNNAYFLLGATANRIETLHVFNEMDLSEVTTEKPSFKDVHAI